MNIQKLLEPLKFSLEYDYATDTGQEAQIHIDDDYENISTWFDIYDDENRENLESNLEQMLALIKKYYDDGQQ